MCHQPDTGLNKSTKKNNVNRIFFFFPLFFSTFSNFYSQQKITHAECFAPISEKAILLTYLLEFHKFVQNRTIRNPPRFVPTYKQFGRLRKFSKQCSFRWTCKRIAPNVYEWHSIMPSYSTAVTIFCCTWHI